MTTDDRDGGNAIVAHPELLNSQPLARAALAEITALSDVGQYIGHVVENEYVASLRFASLMTGYPDWAWTVTLAKADEESAPTVVEVELLPGESSVIAPDWVPWADRLADYRLAQEQAALAAAELATSDDTADSDDSEEEDGLDDDDILDDDDLDDTDELDGDFDHAIDIDDHITDDDDLQSAGDHDDDDDDESDDESDDDEEDDESDDGSDDDD